MPRLERRPLPRFAIVCRPKRNGNTRAARARRDRFRPARTSRPRRRTTTDTNHTDPFPPATPALRYRLPTEAEWEYACRARTTGPFSTGENLTTAQANYNGRQPYGPFPSGDYRQKTTPAGTFGLNPWGLADIHGNVWEWTSDWYGPYGESAAANIDPHGPSSGEKRVIRGGSWFFDANSARCALRYTHASQDKGVSLGFRVAADRAR